MSSCARALQDKVAIITGGSGIARAAVERFRSEGALLVVVDRSAEHLEVLRREAPEATLVLGDLTVGRTVDDVVRTAMERFGRIDVLFNVAGISGRRYGDGPVHEATDEGWAAVMTANAWTTFAMCRAVLRPMLDRRSGVIINTASVLAGAPAAEHFATHAYAASKGAILALTKAMAAYYAPWGIRVNAVVPGLIATPMSERAQHDPAVLDYIRRRQPLTGMPGRPEDVAGAALYLASDAARFVTGAAIEVSGGWSVAG